MSVKIWGRYGRGGEDFVNLLGSTNEVLYIRRNNNKANSIEIGRMVIAQLLP